MYNNIFILLFICGKMNRIMPRAFINNHTELYQSTFIKYNTKTTASQEPIETNHTDFIYAFMYSFDV